MISKILTYFLSETEGCEAQRFIYEIGLSAKEAQFQGCEGGECRTVGGLRR
jgi:hypothetical protein